MAQRSRRRSLARAWSGSKAEVTSYIPRIGTRSPPRSSRTPRDDSRAPTPCCGTMSCSGARRRPRRGTAPPPARLRCCRGRRLRLQLHAQAPAFRLIDLERAGFAHQVTELGDAVAARIEIRCEVREPRAERPQADPAILAVHLRDRGLEQRHRIARRL